MNITELARKLKITPQELRDALPKLGFDIGQRAIKINYQIANRIIRDWPNLQRKLAALRRAESQPEESAAAAQAVKKAVLIPDYITIREFAALAGLPVNVILKELIKNGVFASLNEPIDYDTAWLVGSELGLDVKKCAPAGGAENPKCEQLEEIIAGEKSDSLRPRAPVIVVMGHVDHGKTKLLDAIRRANVVDLEAGGITQHIGAYQITRNSRDITFIDTPGHEAFTAMRSRGAKVADIAILVVAADDGVKPQTVEAYRIIEAAKLPFVVAINKIDKPEANIDKTKQELSAQLNITPEDWGGKTMCLPVSAKAGEGIEGLLDSLLLLADLEAENIRANPEAEAAGTVIESHLDKGAGPVATVLVQNGTLRTGDQFCLGGKIIGRVRSLKNYRGETVSAATPAMPVEIVGLKILPEVGDLIKVGEGERLKAKNLKLSSRATRAENRTNADDDAATAKLNLIIKADVLGSAEAIEESLEKIGTKEVKADIIYRGLGNITDGDIKKAEAAGAAILGFNVKVPPALEEVVREKNVSVKLYQIIYDLIADVKSEMEKLIAPETRRLPIGAGRVLAIFRTDKNSQIIGAKVTEGRAERDAFAEIKRGGENSGTVKITRLQAGKQDVSAVETGQECGLQSEGKAAAAVGDSLAFYREERIIHKLSA